jgi:hypothetical protein
MVFCETNCGAGVAFFLVTFFLAAQEKVTRQRRNRMRKSEQDHSYDGLKLGLCEASVTRYNDHLHELLYRHPRGGARKSNSP